jgi:L-threonylcarbamoyladenylate synthase
MTELADLGEALESGMVVGMATDTVYGLVARAEDRVSYERLCSLKRRDRSKPIAVLVSGLDQALELVEDPDGLVAAASSFWPGPLTVVAKRRSESPTHLGGDRGTVGVRAPSDATLKSLIERCGPLAASSANRAGKPTLTEAEAVRREFGNGLAVIGEGPSSSQGASTVIDVSVVPWRLLREGPITAAELCKVLG